MKGYAARLGRGRKRGSLRREQVRTLQLLLFSVGESSVNDRMFIHSFILSFEDLLYIRGLSNRVTNKTNAVLRQMPFFSTEAGEAIINHRGTKL